MYMNLKPNKHKRISFNATAMTSLGFIDAAPSKLFFCSGRPPSPPNYFGVGDAAIMATPYFSKKLIHLLNVTGKLLTCKNLNLISSGWNTKFFMQLKSTQYLPLPRFCLKLSCKLPSRTRPSIIKLGTNST